MPDRTASGEVHGEGPQAFYGGSYGEGGGPRTLGRSTMASAASREVHGRSYGISGGPRTLERSTADGGGPRRLVRRKGGSRQRERLGRSAAALTVEGGGQRRK